MNKDELILDYLKEQESYIEIAEAIIRSMDFKDEDVKDVIIIRDKLGMIYEER